METITIWDVHPRMGPMPNMVHRTTNVRSTGHWRTVMGTRSDPGDMEVSESTLTHKKRNAAWYGNQHPDKCSH
eukprot:scaffold15168_cov68-Attheya_sp.AAC.2